MQFHSSSSPFVVTTHTIGKMFSLKLTLTTIFAFFAVGQSQQFFIQNWGNGEPTTNYTYTSLEAGRYKVDWRLGAGGNFVAGKGYRGSQNLYGHSLSSSSYQTVHKISQN